MKLNKIIVLVCTHTFLALNYLSVEVFAFDSVKQTNLHTHTKENNSFIFKVRVIYFCKEISQNCRFNN